MRTAKTFVSLLASKYKDYATYEIGVMVTIVNLVN